MGAQHSRADGEGEQHRDRHDDFLWVVLFDGGFEFVNFFEQFLLAESAKKILEGALGCGRRRGRGRGRE